MKSHCSERVLKSPSRRPTKASACNLICKSAGGLVAEKGESVAEEFGPEKGLIRSDEVSEIRER